MDAWEQLQRDCREGRPDVERLLALIEAQQRQLQAAQQRIAELEAKLGGSVTVKVVVVVVVVGWRGLRLAPAAR